MEEQEQQDRMFALAVQESITQEERAKRGGQHCRNRGRGSFLHQNRNQRSRGIGRGQGQDRTHQGTFDHELALSLKLEESERKPAWNSDGCTLKDPTQAEMAQRDGQHGRNRGWRGFRNQICHIFRGMGRGHGQERTHQKTVDHKLALSPHREEDKKKGVGNRDDGARPNVVPPVAPQSAGTLRNDHRMQQEMRSSRQDIQQAVAASLQELQHPHQSQLGDLDAAQLQSQNHHRSQLGRRGNIVRAPAMPDVSVLNDDINGYEALLELEERNVARGLTTKECSKLPTKRYRQTDRQSEGCSVCMDEYKTGDTQKTLPCLHVFHDSCIDPWLKNSARCPVCREVVHVS
ncbi:E3 ubiquitin-protein ligase RNF6-like [Mya arenaria]|uniref:E3 ubiquitin-protein ligase RNF6-like n=1 Tax=Mya arenaria TaxID=6604 RepID=UPI0022E2E88F|nr:E3 ubiquitin-protein ligase RNF6-like [Mya arenaria]